MAADVRAAPTTIFLSDGQSLRFSPLSDRDILELDEWVRARAIADARNSLKDEDDPIIRAETLDAAMRFAQGLTFMSGHGSRILATPEGLSRVLYLSVRKNHPDIKEDALRPLLLAESNKEAVNAAFQHVNLPPEKARRTRNPPKRRPPTPTARRRRR